MTATRRRRGRGTLTREEVAAAALGIADSEGLDALNMRSLAERLGVGTMTLYGYFRSKDELLDAVVDRAVAGRDPFELSGDWRESLRAVVLAARRSLLQHPSLVELRVRRPVLRPEALRFSEAVLAILRGAGLGDRDAARAFRLVFTYTFGYAALSPAAATDESREEARAALAALPAGEYPNLTETLEEASDAMGGEETFLYGLDCILDGLAARLPR